jgi:hypothetical protein
MLRATERENQVRTDKWAQYEREKAALPPTLTAGQRDKAIRDICDRLGI